MKKILILVILSFVIAGCTTSGNAPSKTAPFIGGTTGISISYAEGNPPAEVYDGKSYPFDVVVLLENKGEFTVPTADALITLSGILPAEFGVTEANLAKHPPEDIRASEKNSEGSIIPGAPVYVEFTDLNYQGELSGNQIFPIRADVCYKYQTKAVAHLCILRNNVDLTRETVCKVDETKTVSNSGSPIQVISLIESPRAEKKIGFTFTIAHRGTGDIFKQSTQCSKSSKTDEDKVWIEVKSGIGSGLTCTSLSDGTSTTGYARLYAGEMTVTCTQEVTTTSDYETPVDITVTYDYEEDKSGQILVKHTTN